MSAASLTARLTRRAILAISGATALSASGCSTSNNENTGKPSTAASPTSAAPKPLPAPPLATVEGLIRSVSGNTIQLTQRDRTAATVDFIPSTMVIELAPAQLTDVTAGSWEANTTISTSPTFPHHGR